VSAESVKEALGIVGDAEKPLRNVLLLHQRTVAPSAPVDDFLIGENRFVHRVPVDRHFVGAIRQTALVQEQEQPLRPSVVIGIAAIDFAAPIVGDADEVELAFVVGGDTDTTAAIVGAIVGSGVGREGIPLEWRNGLWEPAHSVDYMERLAEATTNAVQHKPFVLPKTKPLIGILRNFLFLWTVLFHGFRRLFPPY